MGISTSLFARCCQSGLERHVGVADETAEAILKIVDVEEPPLRSSSAAEACPWLRAAYADRLATWEACEAVSIAAQGEPRKNIASF